MTHFF